LDPTYAAQICRSCKRNQGKDIDQYVKRLRELIKPCRYQDETPETIEDRMVMDQIIYAVQDKYRKLMLVGGLLRKTVTLADVMADIKLHESSLKQVRLTREGI